MSFTSVNAVTVLVKGATDQDALTTAFDRMSTREGFETCTLLGDISVACTVKSISRSNLRDFVADPVDGVPSRLPTLVAALDVELADSECDVMEFELTERVTYLGLTRDIPVRGSLLIWPEGKIHFERRSASDGLVRTWKVRQFVQGPRTDRVVDADEVNIIESLEGQTTWILRYFTELEARRSHKQLMSRLEEFLST